MNKMDKEQVVLFSFAVLIMAGAFSLAWVEQTATSITMTGAAVLITLVAAVGPSSIISVKSGPKGFSLQRYIATVQEQAESLDIAKDTPELPREQIQQVTVKAKTRTEMERTDADYLVLSMAAFRDGNQDEALRFAHVGLSLPSSSKRIKATLTLRAGYSYYDFGIIDKAIELYNEAIATDPTFTWPHSNLGNTYIDRDEHDLAIAEYKKAIEKDPKYAIPHYNLACLYSKRRDDDLAIAEYEKAIEKDPKYAESHYGLGTLYYKRGDDDLAIAEYEKAIDLGKL